MRLAWQSVAGRWFVQGQQMVEGMASILKAGLLAGALESTLPTAERPAAPNLLGFQVFVVFWWSV